MKLQISFDLVDLKKALDIAHEVADYCDILEIGTTLLYAHGLKAIESFKKAFEKKTVLVDTKLIDCAEPIIGPLANAGADWITIMAGSNKNLIHTMCKEAEKHNLKVAIDLSDASSKAHAAMEGQNLGGQSLIFHQAYNKDSEMTFMDKWQMVKDNASLPLFISAHINRDSLEQIVSLKPTGIIIGRSIVYAEQPAHEAEHYYRILSKD